MTGLLRRLAGEALGTAHQQPAPPSIRPASTLHSLPPVAMPLEIDKTVRIRPLIEMGGANKNAAEPTPLHPDPHSRDSVPPIVMTGGREHPSVPSERPRAEAAIDGARSAPETGARAQARARAPEQGKAIPKPLLDDVEAEATPKPTNPVAVASARVAPRIAQSSSGAEPAEVHVHIGRIEIIAATTTAPPKKPRAPARNTLLLSDYLARKRRS